MIRLSVADDPAPPPPVRSSHKVVLMKGRKQKSPGRNRGLLDESKSFAGVKHTMKRKRLHPQSGQEGTAQSGSVGKIWSIRTSWAVRWYEDQAFEDDL